MEKKQRNDTCGFLTLFIEYIVCIYLYLYISIYIFFFLISRSGKTSPATGGIGELVGGSQREERIEAWRRAKQKQIGRTLMVLG